MAICMSIFKKCVIPRDEIFKQCFSDYIFVLKFFVPISKAQNFLSTNILHLHNILLVKFMFGLESRCFGFTICPIPFEFFVGNLL